jgi:rhodanese-related sulfurtransferase
MSKILIIYLVLSINILSEEIGCSFSATEKRDILQKKSSVLEKLEKESDIGELKITNDLDVVKFLYQKKEFLIERRGNIKEESCPPHCIQAMSIGNVETVGELKTLDFIKSLQYQKNRILVDARSVSEYKKSTIPGAVNIPHVMIDTKSKLRNEVLNLLGAKKLQKKWYFRNIQKMLIFDNGILDDQATKMIERLIAVGYPQKEILYYRGGLNSWKSLGLTIL